MNPFIESLPLKPKVYLKVPSRLIFEPSTSGTSEATSLHSLCYTRGEQKEQSNPFLAVPDVSGRHCVGEANTGPESHFTYRPERHEASTKYYGV
jgi:hypothetical protein